MVTSIELSKQELAELSVVKCDTLNQPAKRYAAIVTPRRVFGLATIVPPDAGQQADGTETRDPIPGGLQLAWHFTTNPLASPPEPRGFYGSSFRSHGCFGDLRDSKTDSIFAARPAMQSGRRHAPSCMGAAGGQRNWPETRKTEGKPWFTSGNIRNRTFGCFTCFF